MRLAEGSVVAERFEIEARAGVGGMAEVFRARDRTNGSNVALKILRVGDESMTARFEREAVVLARLRHPRLVAYVDHGREADGQPWIAMEWLEGETLVERLRREPPTLFETRTLALGVAQALTEVHRLGVIHRDVKPSNIFLSDRRVEEVKLLDFGIARWVEHAGDLTGTGARVGTFAYMSPEQAWGQRELSPATDVFSLGCVLFACLTGRKPFAAKHSTAVLAKILLAEVPRVSSVRPDIPEELDELVARMMERDVANRLKDGAAVLEALSRISVRVDGRASLPSDEPIEALTATERRIVTLVLAGGLARFESAETSVPVARDAETVVDGPSDIFELELGATARDHGARLDSLADGTLVASFATLGGPADHAYKAASFALSVHGLAPEAPIALGTGLTVMRGPVPYGEVIDRAVQALRRARPGEIRVDDVSAGLLGARFELGGDEGGLRLLGERALGAERRELLGRESPFVGRRRELKTLEALYEECCEEEVARVALVTAPAGFGKSRLRYELLSRLTQEDPAPTILLARADPLTAGSPLGLLADAVRRAASIGESEAPVLRHHRLRAHLARVLGHDGPALERCAVFLGELAGAPAVGTPLEAELAAARTDPRLMGDRMGAAFEEWLAAETRERTVVCVIEDLHWGDSPSVAFLDSALRSLAERPLLLVALARPEVHERFVGLFDGRDVSELRLPGLTRNAATTLVREFLGASAADVTVERLVELAQGNAFYLEELIRNVVETSGDSQGELPPTVLAMVQVRLAALPEEARRVLRAASIFGMRFWRSGVLALLGGEERTQVLDEWVQNLIARELVSTQGETRFAGEQELAFRHALLREGAHAMLTDEDRQKGHRLAAAWLLDVGELDPFVLATHHELGGDPTGAAPYLVAAAEQALEANDLDGCIELARRVEGARVAPELVGRALLASAEAHRWRGDMVDALRCAEGASDRLGEGSARWYRAFTELLVAAYSQGKLQLVRAAIGRAVRARPEPGAFVARAILVCRGIGIEIWKAERLEPWAEIREAADAEGADPILVAWVRAAQSLLSLHEGDYGASARTRAQSVAAFDLAGNRRQACTQRMNEGAAQTIVGRYELAERTLREASAVAESLGLGQTAAWALHNLGLVLHRRGKHAEGLELERTALARAVEQQNLILRFVSHLYLGQMLYEAGSFEAALVDAEAAVELSRNRPQGRCQAHAWLARVQVALGAPAEALKNAELGMSELEEYGIEESQSVIHIALAEALDAVGRHDDATAAAQRGARLLMQAADKITDPEWRGSLLADVPEHAALLARAHRG